MINLIWTSDLHFGLKTDGIDRNEDIYNTTLEIVKYACRVKKEKPNTIFVFGGDVFNTNNPSEEQIGLFTKLLTYLHKYDLKTYIFHGNHDALFDRDRKSSLHFVKYLGHLSENITLIDSIKTLKIKDTDTGPIYFTFLPHIMKSHFDNEKYKGTQDYINKTCGRIAKKLGKGVNHYVFSHLNVKGVHPGSEENLLKKSEVYLPEIFLTDGLRHEKPSIIQAHIHSFSIVDNIRIIGSPIFCTFGEDTEVNKNFLHLEIPEGLGEKEAWNFLPTDSIIFKQAELDLTEVDWKETKFFDLDDVKELLSNIKEDKKYYLKLDITVSANDCFLNFNKIREEIKDKLPNCDVKPIVPKLVRQKLVRSKEQKLGLNPLDAIKVFIKTNKPKGAKRKYSIAKEFCE